MFFKSSKISRKKATEVVGLQKANKDTEINFDTLSAYFKKEFPDREHSDAQAISSLIEEMNKVGIKSLNMLDKKLKQGYAAFIEYEKNILREFLQWLQNRRNSGFWMLEL
jgi:hypothetical protein